MSLSPWMVAAGVVVALLATLRWELADFVLDRIGALANWRRYVPNGGPNPMNKKFVRFEGVEALDKTDAKLLCRIDGRELWIPSGAIGLEDYAVHRPGDCGFLVLTKAAAVELGLPAASPLVSND